MIHLDFTPPDDAAWNAWIQEGDEAAEKMLADVAGKPKIDAALYKRQRDRLLAATHQKCAYCELSITAGQRKGDVEHYRPKGRARRMDGKIVKVLRDGVEIDHPGYYWLAYNYNNLLPACSACNRRAADAASGMNTGKSDIFPTLDDHWAACPEELPEEQPALLNPWLDDPAQHLLFDPDTGIVAGTTERGRITVRLLGLNRDGLPEERRKACEDLRRTLQISIGDAARDGVRAADLNTIQSVRDGSAEYAAVCRVECRRIHDRVIEFLAPFDERPAGYSAPLALKIASSRSPFRFSTRAPVQRKRRSARAVTAGVPFASRRASVTEPSVPEDRICPFAAVTAVPAPWCTAKVGAGSALWLSGSQVSCSCSVTRIAWPSCTQMAVPEA